MDPKKKLGCLTAVKNEVVLLVSLRKFEMRERGIGLNLRWEALTAFRLDHGRKWNRTCSWQ